MARFDRVELTFLGAAAGSHQAVANFVEFDPGESLLDDRLLTSVQGFGGHIDRSHANAWAEPGEQGVRELFFPGEFHSFLRQMTLAIKFEREDRHRAALQNVWHVLSPFLSGKGQRRRGSCPSPRCPLPKNGEMTFRPGSEAPGLYELAFV